MRRPVFNNSWPSDVKAVYKHDMEQTWDPSLAPHLYNEYNNLVDFYRTAFAPSERPLRILDIGCAQATLAMLLAEDGHEVVALDIRPQFLEYAQSRYERGDIRFECGNVFDINFVDSFDLVFVNQVIEHVVRPVELMGRVRSWMRDGSTAVVTTPNGSYLKSHLPGFSDLQPIEKYAHLEHSADGEDHFFAYTDAELREVLLRSGFSNVQTQCLETPWITGHMKFRYLHRLMNRQVLSRLNTLTERIPWVGKRLSYQLLATAQNRMSSEQLTNRSRE